MTVKYMKTKQSELQPDENDRGWENGFVACTNEIETFTGQINGLKKEIVRKIIHHLNECLGKAQRGESLERPRPASTAPEDLDTSTGDDIEDDDFINVVDVDEKVDETDDTEVIGEYSNNDGLENSSDIYPCKVMELSDHDSEVKCRNTAKVNKICDRLQENNAYNAENDEALAVFKKDSRSLKSSYTKSYTIPCQRLKPKSYGKICNVSSEFQTVNTVPNPINTQGVPYSGSVPCQNYLEVPAQQHRSRIASYVSTQTSQQNKRKLSRNDPNYLLNKKFKQFNYNPSMQNQMPLQSRVSFYALQPHFLDIQYGNNSPFSAWRPW